MGFFAKEYTPTFRGFDSYFGFWTDTEDYYSHVSYDNGYGLDLRRDLQVYFLIHTNFKMLVWTTVSSGIVHVGKESTHF